MILYNIFKGYFALWKGGCKAHFRKTVFFTYVKFANRALMLPIFAIQVVGLLHLRDPGGRTTHSQNRW